MSEVEEGEVRAGRARYPIALAVGIGGYVLAVIVGMLVLADDFGPALLTPLWIAHGVLLIVLIRRLGASESSTYATLFIVAVSLISVYIADMAREGLTLQQRGEEVTATVVREWRDAAEGRKARDYHYALEGQDGTAVPGPAMKATSDRYDVGHDITVIADPRGELRPQTPGQADPTGEAVGSAAFALAALGSVAWMTWRGSDTARSRDARKRGPGRMRKGYKAVTRNHSTRAE
ncbi:hypothetical protein [Streptomyces hirsutus]|uniref:hypothetical protein n=1 Tax=Streptomyces hirsutus TaxID=35620 RepID=UPI0033A953D0